MLLCIIILVLKKTTSIISIPVEDPNHKYSYKNYKLFIFSFIRFDHPDNINCHEKLPLNRVQIINSHLDSFSLFLTFVIVIYKDKLLVFYVTLITM